MPASALTWVPNSSVHNTIHNRRGLSSYSVSGRSPGLLSESGTSLPLRDGERTSYSHRAALPHGLPPRTRHDDPETAKLSVLEAS
jgi:hypothetical protein